MAEPTNSKNCQRGNVTWPRDMGSTTFQMKSNALLSKVVGILVVGLLSLVSNEIKIVDIESKYYFDEDTTIVRGVEEEEKVKTRNPPNQVTTGSSMSRINTTTQSSFYDHQLGYNLLLLQRMNDAGDALALSRIQQKSFETKRNLLPSIMPLARRYQGFLSEWGANIVNDEYAYIHIFKNGGTTIAAQTKRSHTRIQNKQVQRRKWFTLVRDPIEHFLSGWAECGYRSHERLLRSGQLHKDYSERVQRWLMRVQMFSRRRNGMNCEVHSMPQVNMFLNYRGEIPTNLEIVGDLKELPAVLDLVGFEYKPSVAPRRNSTENDFKQMYFAKRPDLLSTETMRRLCDYLAIDYYLLDYPLPAPCADMPPHGYTKMPQSVREAGAHPNRRTYNKAAVERRFSKRLAKEGMTV